MELYIGGYAQGKLDYVKSIHPGKTFFIVNNSETLCALLRDKNEAENEHDCDRVLIYRMHQIVKECMEKGEDTQALFHQVFKIYPDCILICDEVGNGIVPLTENDREYRDLVGKILIEAAKYADRVERVICGLGQRIK